MTGKVNQETSASVHDIEADETTEYDRFRGKSNSLIAALSLLAVDIQ